MALPQAEVGSALRSGVVYAGAAAFQRGIIFLLLPIYTRELNPTEYGRLSALLAVAAVAIILFSAGLDTAFFRTYFALRDDVTRRRRFVATAWVFLLVVPTGAAIVLSVAAALLLAESRALPPREVALAVIGAALFVSATVVPMAVFRAEERLRDYLLLTAITTGATASLTLVAVVTLNGGVRGWLIAVILANAITLVVTMQMTPFRPTDGLDHEVLVGALVLGAPLILHMLSHWGLGVSNRLLLVGVVPQHDVGIYALAGNIALPVAILIQGMSQGFMPSYARVGTAGAPVAGLRGVIHAQFVLTLTVAVAGALIGPLAVRYLAPGEYAEAATLVPWITLGYAVLGLYFLPMMAVSLTAGRTRRIWVITVLAAGANVSALLLFVEAFGLVGAAIATVAGYLVLFLGVALYSRGPDNPVRYEWGRLARGALVFVAIYVAAVVTTDDRTLLDASMRLAWILAIPWCLVWAGVIDRDQVRSLLRRFSGRARTAEQT